MRLEFEFTSTVRFLAPLSPLLTALFRTWGIGRTETHRRDSEFARGARGLSERVVVPVDVHLSRDSDLLRCARIRAISEERFRPFRFFCLFRVFAD